MRLGLVLVAAVVVAPGIAAAQPITQPGWRVAIEPGPVLGSARTIGMAGAFAAVAEGAAGLRWNPAAAANRISTYPASQEQRSDWDLSADFIFGLVKTAESDFDGDGRLDSVGADDGFLAFDAGALYQNGTFGIGAEVTGTINHLGAVGLHGTESVTNVIVAPAFVWRAADLVLSPGLQISIWSLAIDGRKSDFSIAAATLAPGVLWRPAGTSLRIGATMRLQPGESSVAKDGLTAEEKSTNTLSGNLYLPNQVSTPVSGSLGVAYRFAATPWNLPPHAWDTSDATKAPVPQRFLTISAELSVLGPVKDAYAPSALFDLAAPVATRGEATVTPRLGLEAEVVPDFLRLRAGFYLEDARFVGTTVRAHGTYSVDVRVGRFDRYAIRVGAYGDNAERYHNVGVSVGLWR